MNQLPGVMVEGEDGFGLRLNIGMRGASPHRSKKILLLEEGTLMQPALTRNLVYTTHPLQIDSKVLKPLKDPLLFSMVHQLLLVR